MNDAGAVDAVFVIHQDVPLEALRRACRDLPGARMVILTTHKPFSNEIPELRQLGEDVRILSFASLLSDEEMAQCDAAATNHCRETSSGKSRFHYVRGFMAESRRLKNRIVCEKALRQFQPRRVFVAQDLGIEGTPWFASGAQSLSCPPQSVGSPGAIARLRRLLLQEITVVPSTSDQATQRSAVILGPVHRIAIREGQVALRQRWLSADAIRRISGEKLFERTVSATLSGRGASAEFDLCTTVHSYSAAMSELATRLKRTLRVLVDGHHPSNYSLSYLDGFGECVFVASNHVSARWFERNGRSVVPALWFQPAERFVPCSARNVRSVMLVLNHAGDWSALINRSDTDLVVEEFVEMAAAHPDLQFVIRLHPTMATPEHEGVNSMKRILAFLASRGPANLSVSDRPLAEDLARCDLYVSEYSQVLIDAWKRGRLGVAFNPTSRRSFMDDYRSLGFPHVQGRGALKGWVMKVRDAPAQLCASQNAAVQRFNRCQETWERAAPGTPPRDRSSLP